MQVNENPVETRANNSEILAKTIKTGIIKSNLIPMFAGATLAMYTYQFSLIEKLPELIFAFIGTAFVIGGAGALNNYYDRDIDSIMERTKERPTVTGEIQPKTVLWLSIVRVYLTWYN